MMIEHENRDHERYETHQSISYRLAGTTDYKSGTTCNLSKQGFLLETGESIPVGEKLDLALRIDAPPVHFKGTCIHTGKTDNGNFLAGILVLKINTSGMEPYLTFIDTLKANHLKSYATMDNMVQRIAAEHRIITQYVMVIQGIMADTKSGTSPMAIETVLDLMQKELSTHFYIEEKLIFKTGLIHLPTEFHALITELTREHTALELELNQIIDSIQGLKRQEGLLENELNEKIETYLTMLKKHATKELTELFPILESDEKAIQKLIRAVGHIVTG